MAETKQNNEQQTNEQQTNEQPVVQVVAVPGEWAQKAGKIAKGVGIAGAMAGLFGLGWFAKSKLSSDDEDDDEDVIETN